MSEFRLPDGEYHGRIDSIIEGDAHVTLLDESGVEYTAIRDASDFTAIGLESGDYFISHVSGDESTVEHQVEFGTAEDVQKLIDEFPELFGEC